MSQPVIQLDARSHTYTVDGVVTMNVTRPLQDLKGLENAPRETLRRARERGTMADRAIMLYAADNLVEDTLDPVLAPYLSGWKKAVAKYGIRVLALQCFVHHPVYHYAGTFDLLIEMDRPPRHITSGAIMTEVKIVDTVGPEVGLQLSAYAEAYNHQLELLRDIHSPRARHRLALQLLADNDATGDPGDFMPHWFQKRTDFMTFVGCLYRTNWRIEHGYETLKGNLGDDDEQS